MLCALLADCETLEDIYDYARAKKPVLRQFLSLPAGIPPYDTLNRVSRPSRPHAIRSVPHALGAVIVAQLAGQQLSVGGKQLRSTTLTGQPRVPVTAKRIEAVALPQVLELVDVAGSVVGLDALGTPPALATRLREREANCVLAEPGANLHTLVCVPTTRW